jgi:transposase
MKTQTKFVGLDVHKDTVVIAIAEAGRAGEVRAYGTISNDLHALEKALRKIGGEGITLHVVYEAGPTGFVIYRRLQQLGIDCAVVAPSKLPKKTGEKIKTDKRDAEKLARLHRAGELTAVHVPDAVDESVRDLCRARSDAMEDLRRAKQRLKLFLLRIGYRYKGRDNWSEAHVRYLRELVMPLPVHRCVLEDYLRAIDEAAARLERLLDMLAAQVARWRLAPAVDALMCLRGFQLVAAATLVAEIGDARRFEHPRHLMAYLGLIPSEHTTGSKRRLGSITKTGNGHARWMLIECAQHVNLPPKVSTQLAQRQEGQPEIFKHIGWKAQTRLHKRYWQLAARRLMTAKIHVAVARELTGFVWDVLRTAWQRYLPDTPAPMPEPAHDNSTATTRA